MDSLLTLLSFIFIIIYGRYLSTYLRSLVFNIKDWVASKKGQTVHKTATKEKDTNKQADSQTEKKEKKGGGRE